MRKDSPEMRGGVYSGRVNSNEFEFLNESACKFLTDWIEKSGWII